VSTRSPAPFTAHGWTLYAHPVFVEQVEALVAEVQRLKKRDPEGYQGKNPAKRLAAIVKLAFDVIPADPTRPEYRLGHTLGDGASHWFRAKFFQQYRLFFRFHAPSKILILAWVNDEETKRAYESADDAYRVFAGMLRRGRPPDDWERLLAEARASDAGLRSLRGGSM
jgi:toxin YhaV